MKVTPIAALVIPAAIAINALSATSSLAITPTWQDNILTRNGVNQDGSTYNVFNYAPNSKSTDWSYATQGSVNSFGVGYSNEKRKTLSNALGAPQFEYDQNNTPYFLSLGLGGQAIFEFDTLFFPEITLWETSNGDKSSQSAFDEQVEVYVGNDLSNWQLIGTVLNITDGAYNHKTGATIKSNNESFAKSVFKYVKLVDKSAQALARDGFDVNAIAVKRADVAPASVPEPASLFGLLAFGTFGVSSVMRRKN